MRIGDDDVHGLVGDSPKKRSMKRMNYTWNHWSIAFKCHIYSVVSALSLFALNQTAGLNLQFSNTTRNVLVSTEISVNIPQLSPFNVKILYTQSVVLISNSPKNISKNKLISCAQHFLFFSSLLSSGNQYQNPCFTRTSEIFTATDFRSKSRFCNKIIIKVQKMGKS